MSQPFAPTPLDALIASVQAESPVAPPPSPAPQPADQSEADLAELRAGRPGDGYGTKDVEGPMGERYNAIATRHKYTHEAMIDLMLQNPTITQVALAKHFGVSNSHIGYLQASDAFQARLALRRDRDVLPAVREEIEARSKAMALRSLAVIQEKLAGPANTISEDLALKAAALGAKMVGVGGFGVPQAPAPAVPAADRMVQLAERLTALIPDRKAGAIDVESREIPPSPAP